MYKAGDLGKYAFSRVMMDRENDEITESCIRQMMTYLSYQVEAITITQGTVDWKYGRRFGLTSATSYDIIKPCCSKFWHLFENKAHWRTVKGYLDGSFPFESEETEEQQEPIEEVEDQASNDTEDGNIPQSYAEKAAEDIRWLNSNQLTAADLRMKHYFNEVPYLEAFISHVVRNSETRFRKKMPASINTLKKAVDQWLNEPNKEKRKFFFLKLEGLYQAMTRKYGINWKTQHFPANQRIIEAQLLEKLGMENFSGSNDEQACKEVLLTTIFKQSFYPSLKGAAKEAASIGHKLEVPLCRALFNEVPSLKAAFQVGLIER